MTEPIEQRAATAGGEPRRRGSAILTGLAALALVGALTACQPPEDDPGGGGTDTTPVETLSGTEDSTNGGSEEGAGDTEGGADGDTDGGTEEDTDGDTGGSGGGTDAGLPDFSDAVFPECGDSFALPQRTSGLIVEGGPSEALPEHGGGWTATVTNSTGELIQGQIAMMQLVIVDGEGEVVAAPDPDDSLFLGAEGPYWMGIEAGGSLEVGIPMMPSCDTGDWLLAGEYQAFATITFVGSEGDFGDMEQAQGGPWDITVGGGDSEVGTTVPEGAVLADLECGATWDAPDIGTGYELELIHSIRSPRSVTDDIDGSALLHTSSSVNGLTFTLVLVLKDGEIVNWTPGSDTATLAAATGGASIPLGFTSELFACGTEGSPKPLPMGGYQAVVVAVTADEEGTHVLAATDPVALELR